MFFICSKRNIPKILNRYLKAAMRFTHFCQSIWSETLHLSYVGHGYWNVGEHVAFGVNFLNGRTRCCHITAICYIILILLLFKRILPVCCGNLIILPIVVVVVGIATGYGLDDQEVGVWVPLGSRIFSSPRRPDRLWGPPNFLSNGYRLDHSPPTSAEVKKM
jgi:hypothetical protein